MGLPRLNRAGLQTYLNAAQKLREDTPRRFGTMSPNQMVRHLRHTLDVSYGAKDDPPRHNWFTRSIGRIVVFHIFTRWPGGVLKQPDSWSPPPEDGFEVERQRLLDALKHYVEEQEKSPDRTTISPLLGPLTLKYWGHIHSVHFAHHFRQFGLH